MPTTHNTIIKQFVHRKYPKYSKNSLSGLLLAVKAEDTVFITWSSCCPWDRFDKNLAETIALSRVATGTTKQLPFFMEEAMEKFKDRAKRYFRVEDAQLILK